MFVIVSDFGLQKNFFIKIDNLSPKQRVSLKRSCGQTLSETDIDTLTTFYQILPSAVNPFDEEKWFYSACIHTLNSDDNICLPLEQIIKIFWNQKDVTESFKKRVIKVMDTPWDEDGYFSKTLLRFIKTLSQKGYAVDACQLLSALLEWNSDSHKVQKKWIKTIVNNQEEK